MTSTAQKRANQKYQKEKVRQQLVKFYPTEADLYEYLSIQSNKMGLIKSLLAEDMREAMDYSNHIIDWDEGGSQRFDTYGEWVDTIKDLRGEGYPVEVWGCIAVVHADLDDYLEQ